MLKMPPPKVLFTALALSGVALFGLSGCAGPEPEQPPREGKSNASNAAGSQSENTESTTPPPSTPEPQAAPVADDINGRWCPTPESSSRRGCVTIALPNATYDDGTVSQLSSTGESEGGFSFMVPGAPFGTYFPAGVAIAIPDYYPGADLPEQDRIWNGQTGSMMLRE